MNGQQESPQSGANTVLLTVDQLRAQHRAIREERREQIRPVLEAARPQRIQEPWYKRFRPELYLLVSLLGIGTVFATRNWSKSQGSGNDSTVVPMRQAPANAPGVTLGGRSYLGEQLTHSDAALSAYIATNHARTRLWVGKVIASNAFGADAVSETDARALARIMVTLKNDQNPSDDEMKLVRGTLYPYAYGTWVLQQSSPRLPDGFKLAPSFNGYEPSLVATLVQRMDLTDVLGNAPDPKSAAVSTAIVMRLLQTYAPGATSL
jgi:hypothetical protein